MTPRPYISNAIHDVTHTLIDTLLIVRDRHLLFLGSFRSVLVPVVAIPVSLIGGVFLMQAFGFTLNLLTLLAIVLSVGLWWTTPLSWWRMSNGTCARADAAGRGPDPARAS